MLILLTIILVKAGNDNTNGNPNNIIFTVKDTKLYVPVVTLSSNHIKTSQQRIGKINLLE